MTERRAGRDRHGRRRHPAMGARILAAGLSLSATLGITGALGAAARSTGAPPTGSETGASTAAVPVEVDGGRRVTRVDVPRAASTEVPPAATVIDATTHGSR